MTRAHVGAEQLAPFFEHGGTKGAALWHGETLPHGLEHRVVLVEQAPQRRVELIEINAAGTRGARVVPRFMREPLNVVGQVARELDDGCADPRFGPKARLLEPRLEKLGELFGRNPFEPHHRARLVEWTVPREHALHQARLRSRKDVTDLALMLNRGAKGVLHLV